MAAPKEVIRIRMEAYDHAILDQSAQEIVDTAKFWLEPQGRASRPADLEGLERSLPLPRFTVRHPMLHRLLARAPRASAPPTCFFTDRPWRRHGGPRR